MNWSRFWVTAPSRRLKVLLSWHDQGMSEMNVPGRSPVRAYGRRHDLDDHLAMLEADFAGRPMIALYHAALIVLIRRGIDAERSLQRFFALWDGHADRLLRDLDTRWLVSAAGTFMEHGRDPGEVGMGLTGNLMLNIIKLYETERHFTPDTTLRIPYLDAGVDDEARRAARRPAPLLDGMDTFVVGHGDLVANLFTVVRGVAAQYGVAGRILLELLDRSRGMDTVLHRFAELHRVERTAW